MSNLGWWSGNQLDRQFQGLKTIQPLLSTNLSISGSRFQRDCWRGGSNSSDMPMTIWTEVVAAKTKYACFRVQSVDGSGSDYLTRIYQALIFSFRISIDRELVMNSPILSNSPRKLSKLVIRGNQLQMVA